MIYNLTNMATSMKILKHVYRENMTMYNDANYVTHCIEKMIRWHNCNFCVTLFLNVAKRFLYIHVNKLVKVYYHDWILCAQLSMISIEMFIFFMLSVEEEDNITRFGLSKEWSHCCCQCCEKCKCQFYSLLLKDWLVGLICEYFETFTYFNPSNAKATFV